MTPEQLEKIKARALWRVQREPITLSRNTAVLIKTLGAVQANLANSPDIEVHERLLDLLKVMPRTGMSRLQVGMLDKMIGEEESRIVKNDSLREIGGLP